MPVSRQAGWIDPFLAKSGPLRKSTLLYSVISILKYYFDLKDFTRKKLFIQEMLDPPTHDILFQSSIAFRAFEVCQEKIIRPIAATLTEKDVLSLDRPFFSTFHDGWSSLPAKVYQPPK